MKLGFNMDIRDFSLSWDFDNKNDLMNYSIRIRNTLFEIKNLTQHEVWKINNIFNEEVNTALFGYVDFDDVVTQATGRKII